MSLIVVLNQQSYEEVYKTDQKESGEHYMVERRYGFFEIGFDVYRLNGNVNEGKIEMRVLWGAAILSTVTSTALAVGRPMIWNWARINKMVKNWQSQTFWLLRLFFFENLRQRQQAETECFFMAKDAIFFELVFNFFG